jgi:hypothetical protein
VELLVPVPGAAQREQLDRILDLYLQDGTGWSLRADGRYVCSASGGPSAQATLAPQADVMPSASRTVAPTG